MTSTEAPTLSSGSSLRLKTKKEKEIKLSAKKNEGRRLTKKNILCSPYPLAWPKVEASTEEKIIDCLLSTLNKFPRLCPEVRTRTPGSTSSSSEIDEKSNKIDEDIKRKKIRAQLAIGHREASKCLERDQLSLLLVWEKAEPSIIIKCFIPLAATRLCPALCLQSLGPKLSQATGLTSAVAIGFKKTQPGLDDFKDFVTLAASLAPQLSVPWMKAEEKGDNQEMVTDNREDIMTAKEGNSSTETEGESNPVESAGATSKQDDLFTCSVNGDDWPTVEEDVEEKVVGKLLCLLTQYKSVFKKPKNSLRTNEWKRKQKVIRNHLLTDASAIRDSAKSGKLCLLLVQKEQAIHPAAAAAAMYATRTFCPVLVMRRLRQQLSPVIRNPLFPMLAFRKCDKDTAEFSEFITFASQHTSSDLRGLFPPREDASKEEVPSAMTTSDVKRQTPKKRPAPVYNVSHLYVYKNDSAKPPENVGGKTSLDTLSPTNTKVTQGGQRTIKEKVEDFISLSSEPVVEMLGQHPEGEIIFPDIILDNKKGASKKPDSAIKGWNLKNVATQSFSGILGMDADDLATLTTPPVYCPRQPAKTKATLKRKLKNMEEDEEYLSFSLCPTNIQTSISNPNKTRKKKK